ncbi:hypothetical protein JZ751_016759 [Albula glossodonta]|uniref:Uncharacterized protein n=1 Tax=Albula glossodonta TaxID=121402 RepID=A0A8T2P0U1_9TELE|nr:hypothetical protein JZ751_016759 [Albula glossodonta]
MAGRSSGSVPHASPPVCPTVVFMRPRSKGRQLERLLVRVGDETSKSSNYGMSLVPEDSTSKITREIRLEPKVTLLLWRLDFIALE